MVACSKEEHEELARSYDYCYKCGEKLKGERIHRWPPCPYCGKTTSIGWTFCGWCGKRLKDGS